MLLKETLTKNQLPHFSILVDCVIKRLKDPQIKLNFMKFSNFEGN